MGVPVDKEKWKDVVGYEGLYKVSNYGNIFSNYSNKILNPNRMKAGYLSFELFKNKKSKRLLVHRLVAFAFIENLLNLPQVNHKDENKSNNVVENLEWNSAKENMNYGTRIERQRKNTDYTQERRKIIAIENGKKACIPVIQSDKTGNFLNFFESAKSASQKLKINASHIAETCLGKRKSAGGYVWNYKRGNDLSVFQ